LDDVRHVGGARPLHVEALSAVRVLHDRRGAADDLDLPLLVQRPCTGASDQQWQIQVISGTTAVVKNANSGKCLDVQGSSTANMANIIQSDCADKNSQKWDLVDRGSGVVSLRSVGSGKCVDVSGASTADDGRFIQYTCHTGTNQQFRRQ
ncbi:MAG TPA: RICIN domain-containing protein, partial [Sorangium sp.]|nr:RICIN domain-containing protein [Sorangium sp.]